MDSTLGCKTVKIYVLERPSWMPATDVCFSKKGWRKVDILFIQSIIILLSLCPVILVYVSCFYIFFYKHYLQVLEDLRTIWNWVLTEKLHINPRDRGLYSAILVLGKTFDNLGISPFIIHRILRCKVGSPVYEVHLYVLMKS